MTRLSRTRCSRAHRTIPPIDINLRFNKLIRYIPAAEARCRRLLVGSRADAIMKCVMTCQARDSRVNNASTRREREEWKVR